MLGNLEGYTGDGYNQRRAYIGANNLKNYMNDKKALEEKVKKEEQMQLEKKINEKINKVNLNNNTLNQMNNLMHKNTFK